ncbi:methyltransferase family protein [Pseudonocardia endophytica]|uniref:Methyltransferase family protein n=1 Tax=Pseudonocardia endophytica TaxID=401976 RepID=A0A4R1I9Z9_PSEEN|nr:methyltransferase family protein [Pseudonocardia endophytica]
MRGVDGSTDELRRAHDTIAEFYAEKLPEIYAQLPVEQAVVDLFCTLVRGVGRSVADVGCGPGAIVPYLVARGLEPHGVDLSPEMVRAASRDHPDVPFTVADVRGLPFADASLDGVLGWYSLMYLAPSDRPRAFAEITRVVRPGGYLVVGYKQGDDSRRRGGRRIGVEFDIYWYSQEEVERRVTDAGFRTVFRADRPAGEWDEQPQGYLIAQRD